MTTPIRVMHFADTHFGVENYGRLDPATGLNTRLLDFRRSLCSAIDIALAEEVHLAVFAGDAYKNRDPSQTHQREFASCVRRLTERGVPVVMLTGNHDVPNVRGRAHAMEIWRTLGVSDVRIVSTPEVFTVETAAGTAQIAALPYLMKGFLLAREEFLGKSVEEAREAMETRYARYVEEIASQCDPALPTIFMGHFWVRSARLSSWQQGYFNANEPQVSVADLARPEFDYVALGHIHRRQDLNRGAHPPVVYCGSPDTIDFGEKGEPKGFVIADVARGASTYRFVDVPDSRRFIEIEAEADNEVPTETILAEIRKHDLRDAIVRLTYRISAENLSHVREKELREALAPAFLVVAIRRDVQRDQLTRSKVLTESLDPASALSHYLDTHPRLGKRKAELLQYADLLFDELRREEALK